MKFNHYLGVFLFLMAFIVVGFWIITSFDQKEEMTLATVKIKNMEIKVEVAKSLEEKVKGLSGRDGLATNSGMIFIYDEYLVPGFWMKDMKFPIDIIWIKDNMVVGFEKNAPANYDNDPITYKPKSFVDKVLEVKAGFVDEKEIKIGDEVDVIF